MPALPLRSATPLVLALFAATASGLLRRTAQAHAPAAVDLELDVPPIPGDVARPLAFGFRSLLADFTFLEAVQLLPLRNGDLSQAESLPLDRRMRRLLEYSVEVDPKFPGAYRFIGAALPHETMDGKVLGVFAAVELLDKGVRERPDDWHIPFVLGFLQSYYLRDYAAAGRNLALAAKDEGAPRYLGLLATRLSAQSGNLQLATELAETMLAQANEEDTRRMWQERVDDLHMERDLRAIEAAAARYRQDHGSAAPSIAALVAAGDLRAEPREPHGGRYELLSDGTARSTAAERLHVFGGAARLEVH